ncbi:MAG: metal ABC transporter ATP-binding protein [Ruminococcaceae bacterium]|nr:metal ABC transporter ATP-binding protein [Oscillospiraceae bacterium]
MSLLSCENISLGYDGNIILSDLSLEVNEGDYIYIVGENGSGKSTFIKALLSLKNVSKGKIKFSDGLKKYEIGYLPQQSDFQKDFPANVYEIVLSGCLNSRGLRPFYSKKEKNTALENMKKMGIENLLKKSYSELSGGQQQRVLFARALCATKKLLLLDEPYTGLDPVATLEMYNLIEKINKDGISVIMVSHDIKTAVKYASHILHLGNKEIFFGKTEDYLKSKFSKEFMGGE